MPDKFQVNARQIPGYYQKIGYHITAAGGSCEQIKDLRDYKQPQNCEMNYITKQVRLTAFNKFTCYACNSESSFQVNIKIQIAHLNL